MRFLLLLGLLVPLLTGCETIGSAVHDIGTGSASDERARPPKPKRSGEPLLTYGVFEFEEGNYAEAERLLRLSLATGLPTRASRARAHKYLAFTYCVTHRVPQCREEFSRALGVDPGFTLTAAEAGHPTWGPAFRSIDRDR